MTKHEVTLTNRQVRDLYPTLVTLASDRAFKRKVAWPMATLLSALRQAWHLTEEGRQSLIDGHTKLDDDGQPMRTAVADGFVPTFDDPYAFEQAWTAYLRETQTVSVPVLAIDVLPESLTALGYSEALAALLDLGVLTEPEPEPEEPEEEI